MRSLFCCLGALVVCQTALAQHATDRTERERSANARMIDVGGYRLKANVRPGKLPAIVFENGGGMGYDVWDGVREALEASTDNAIVSYNRAGIHGSELYEGEYDIYKEVDGLHRLLEALNLSDSFLYAGHSYGGFVQYAYASKYPDNIKALLFLDPNTIDYTKWSDADEKERANYNIDHITDPVYKEAMTRQAFGFPKVESEVGRIPAIAVHCTLITAGQNQPSEGLSAWRNGQIELAKRCGSSEFLIARDSDHMIQIREPELVARKIEELLER